VPIVVARLVVVGGGKMGEALVSGLLSDGWASPEQIVVAEKLEGRRAELLAPRGLAGRNPGLVVVDEPASAPDTVGAEGAVVAVKPGDVESACGAIAAVRVRRVVSIAAGVPIARLEAWLGHRTAVVRAMPNTAALVGAGAAAVAAGSHAGDEDLAWARGILASVGTVSTVPESLLDAVTGLSGSGPAYLFLVAEALIEAGVLVGLPRDVSTDLTVQTLLGSARLLSESSDGPETLRAAVTSPGGTTAAGLRALERAGVRNAFLDAVAAATERSRELGAG
jgi:pyrroline-5-carboxylate reductase